MAAKSDLVSGTITLTNGSTDFTGAGTSFALAQVTEGDEFKQIAGQTQWDAMVATITSNTAGTLVRPWGGATGTYAYRLRFQADGQRVTAQARELIELLGNGNLQAMAGLSGSADQLLMFSGPGAMTTVPRYEVFGGGNVKNFGAVGNGIADDTAAIQAAFNSLAASGGAVYFPPGSFKITSTIVIPTNVRGLGAGREATVIQAVGCTGFSSAAGNENLELAYMHIVGNGTIGTSAVRLVNNPRGILLRHLYINNFGGFGIVLDGTGAEDMWGATLENCIVEDSGGGFRLIDTNATTLLNCIGRHNGGFGLDATYSGSFNSASLNVIGGVYEGSNSSAGAVTGKAYGIHVKNMWASTLVGVYTERNDDGHLWLENCDTFTVQSLFGNGNNGAIIPNGLVRLDNVTNSVFSGCDFHSLDNGVGTGKANVFLNAGSGNNTFISCKFERDGAIGPGNFHVIDLGPQNKFINCTGPGLEPDFADYGVGSFQLLFGTGEVGVTGTRSLEWSANGDDVVVNCQLSLTSKGSSVGAATLVLPPSVPMPRTVPVGVVGRYFNMAGLAAGLIIAGSGGSRTLIVATPGAVNAGTLDNTSFSNTSFVPFVIQYKR